MMQRYKIGKCIDCGGTNRQLIAGRCISAPLWCYQKHSKARYEAKQAGRIKVAPEPLKKVSEKTIPSLLRLSVMVFNKWIKKRDSIGDQYICISCGEEGLAVMAHAGHYRASTFAATRFHEDNVFLQCPSCNVFKDGNEKEYRKTLRVKIGDKRLEHIEHLSLQPHKWSREDLLEIINKYKTT